jgi:magnesium and cobalt transporter
MNEDASSSGSGSRSWFGRLTQALSGEPRNREELLEELRNAQANGLMTPDTLSMMEGAIAVSEQMVADVMIPRAQMVTVSLAASLPEILRVVVESGHSRFAVTGEDRDEIVGILLAKDLLKCFVEGGEKRDIRSLLRKVALIPESKRLNELLTDFRVNRHHMAIVVDEFGGVAGLVTIEDVLEEIVGDISDEHDEDEAVGQIVAQADGRWLVNALTPIDEFNERFGTGFPDDEFDTIGGLVTAAHGHLPMVGEAVDLEGIEFKVARADSRRLQQLAVRPPAKA